MIVTLTALLSLFIDCKPATAKTEVMDDDEDDDDKVLSWLIPSAF